MKKQGSNNVTIVKETSTTYDSDGQITGRKVIVRETKNRDTRNYPLQKMFVFFAAAWLILALFLNK